MKVLAKSNLVLNWKNPKQVFRFISGNSYEVPKFIAQYLIEKYKFEKVKYIIKNEHKRINKSDLVVRERKNMSLSVGIVNYKSLIFIEHQLKTLFEFNSIPFKLIIVDNSIPSEYEKLKTLCEQYDNVCVIKNEPTSSGTSCQHSEGLYKMFEQVDSDYLLVQDPDFFWVKKDYLKLLKDKLDEGYVCVGAPFYREDFSNDTTPALWGCAYDVNILEKEDFYSFENLNEDEILKQLIEGKDTGWRLREKFEKQNLPTFSFNDSLGISHKHSFSNTIEHYLDTDINSIHEYRYNDEVIAYHLSHGCHELENSFPSMSDREKICNSKWDQIRKEYSDYFFNLIKE
jgi:hypothetical protein